jgi:tetratricopeptide (TPR) repeat protein
MMSRNIILALLVCACVDKDKPAEPKRVELPPPPVAPEPPPPNKSPLTLAEYPTTDGGIAVGNLEAQILGLEKTIAQSPKPPFEQRVGLVSAYLTRAQFLGKISDYDRAEELVNALAKESPKDANVLLVRASARGALHQYKDALADLDAAAKTFKDGRTDVARAVILQAMGRYDEALAIRQAQRKQRETLASMSAEASVHAERGEIADAERIYTEAQYKTRDVSPFPFAFMHLQQGLMWQKEGRFARAREFFEAAHERVPRYAPAISHLAAVMAQMGEKDQAVALLRPLAEKSDDPEYAGQLGQLSGDATMIEKAKKGFDALLAKHPDAFADHAARFYLTVDAKRALELAQKNLKLRPTPDAHELLINAALAATDSKLACTTADAAMKLKYKSTALDAACAKAYSACGKTEQATAARKLADDATAAVAAALTSRASSTPGNAATGP